MAALVRLWLPAAAACLLCLVVDEYVVGSGAARISSYSQSRWLSQGGGGAAICSSGGRARRLATCGSGAWGSRYSQLDACHAPSERPPSAAAATCQLCVCYFAVVCVAL